MLEVPAAAIEAGTVSETTTVAGGRRHVPVPAPVPAPSTSPGEVSHDSCAERDEIGNTDAKHARLPFASPVIPGHVKTTPSEFDDSPLSASSGWAHDGREEDWVEARMHLVTPRHEAGPKTAVSNGGAYMDADTVSLPLHAADTLPVEALGGHFYKRMKASALSRPVKAISTELVTQRTHK